MTGRRVQKSLLKELDESIALLDQSTNCQRVAVKLRRLVDQCRRRERPDFHAEFFGSAAAHERAGRDEVVFAVAATLDGGIWTKCDALANLARGTGSVGPELAADFERYRERMPKTAQGIRNILTQKNAAQLLGPGVRVETPDDESKP